MRAVGQHRPTKSDHRLIHLPPTNFRLPIPPTFPFPPLDMGQEQQTPSDLLSLLREHADADGMLSLPTFVEIALYHPQHGYYRQDRDRVGRNQRSDFFTSSSLREAFSLVVAEAATALLAQANLTPAETTWVEIGAEPDAPLLDPSQSPFAAHRTIRVGDSINIEGNCVVFSNELFDAQPFRQVRLHHGVWTEFAVSVSGSTPILAPTESPASEILPLLETLPSNLPEGYTIDLPTGARSLAETILAQPWQGAFIAFDYGKTWQSLLTETPQGTARGYRAHQLIPDFLESPGQQDITHHICWDHLESALATAGFTSLSLQSQESFIVHRAPQTLQQIFDPTRSAFDPIRRKLKELMHPALMGHKFQALSALRPTAP